jgi:hypothetical protein
MIRLQIQKAEPEGRPLMNSQEGRDLLVALQEYPISCDNSLARRRLRHLELGSAEHLQLQRDRFPFDGCDVL